MRVICIIDHPSGLWSGKNKRIVKGPSYYGEVLNVASVDELNFYLFEEFPQSDGFNPKFFIPLSDIDETQMERDNLKEEITCTQ